MIMTDVNAKVAPLFGGILTFHKKQMNTQG